MALAVVVPPGAVRPILVTLHEVAALLCRSPAAVRKQLALGLLPAPAEGGGRRGKKQRWRLAEIESWVACGMPPRAEWEGRRRAKRKR
jgi:hypothetical protein